MKCVRLSHVLPIVVTFAGAACYASQAPSQGSGLSAASARNNQDASADAADAADAAQASMARDPQAGEGSTPRDAGTAVPGVGARVAHPTSGVYASSDRDAVQGPLSPDFTPTLQSQMIFVTPNTHADPNDPGPCQPSSAFAALEQAACAKAGLPRIVSEYFNSACPSAHATGAVVLCVQEVPAGKVCYDGYLGSAAHCVTDALLEQTAGERAKSAGAELGAFQEDGLCGPAASHFIHYEYCELEGQSARTADGCKLVELPEAVTDQERLENEAMMVCGAAGGTLMQYDGAFDASGHATALCCPDSF